MPLKKKNLVEKRNVLNELRRNNFTLQEMRFFSIYLSKINPRDLSTRRVRFPLEDFRNIMEFGRLNVAQLRDTTDSLLSKIVSVPTERGGYISFQLFKECTVDQDEFGQWYVEIDAHDKSLPLMFDFKRDYFTYELWNALRLKSGNQLRMYELLKQYEKIGSRQLTLPELKRLLGIDPDEYPRWDNFKRRILDSCQEALAKNTDICFDYKPIKSGRKITGVAFTIRPNKEFADQLTLDEFIDLQSAKVKDSSDLIDVDFEVSEPSDNPHYFQDLLATACCPPGSSQPEFTELQMQELRATLALVPESKFPEKYESEGLLMQAHHYLAARYAYMCRRSEETTIKNRFSYLLKLIQLDAEEDEA